MFGWCFNQDAAYKPAFEQQLPGVGFIAHPPLWVRLKDGVLGQRGDVQTSWALKRLRGAGIASPRSEICLSSVGNSGLQQTLNSRTGTGATICTPLYLVHT